MLEWWKRMSHFGKVCGIIAAASGALVGAVKAYPLIEPYLLAHRGYVMEHVGGVQTNVNDLLVWRFEDAKNKARSEQADWTIKLQKEQDPQTRGMIQRRIEHLGEEQHTLDERIKKLKGQ